MPSMIMGEEACDVGLALGLGVGGGGGGGGRGGEGGGGGGRKRRDGEKRSSRVQLDVLFPTTEKEREESAVSDRPNKEEEEEEEEEDEDHGGGSIDGGNRREGSRKKLRLTKEQFSLLEESFRQHSTLNPVQKKELADRLKLRARQVEVWFQNRRARTKLKKTEVDCELLRKFCDSLSNENRRLKKELQELRTMKTTSPLHVMRLAKTAAIVMCPSCQRLVADETVTGFGASAAAVAGALDAKLRPPPYGHRTATL